MNETGSQGGIMKFRNELIGTTTDTLILSVLYTGPAHSYDIARRINELSDGIFEWQDEIMHPALHKLEDHGFIHGTWIESANGKTRCVYSLTKEGRFTLAAEANEWSAYSNAVAAILEASYA
jgi:PadR family transcriptional regulator, regulatory protein PadR